MPKENTSSENKNQPQPGGKKPKKTPKVHIPPRRCGIKKDTIYFMEEIEYDLGVTPGTVQFWLKNGLRSAKPKTQRRYILGDDIIAFMFSQK